MAAFLIMYDINKEGAAYSAANKLVADKIKSLSGTWWHHLDSTWIVVASMTAVQIRDAVGSVLDSNDELLVMQSSGTAAWQGFNDQGSKWLNDNI